MVQWLGLHASTSEGRGSIPGQGKKILQAVHGVAKIMIIIIIMCLSSGNYINLFICLLLLFAVLGRCFGVQASHHSGFSCCRACGL